MRKLIVILVAVMLSGASFAWSAEKALDLQNSPVPADFHSVMTGALTPNSPTYNRGYGDQVGNSCDAPLIDSANDDMYLEIFCIKSTDTQPVELMLDAAGTNIIDTVLTLYCTNFDPSNPLANAIAFDDDGGEGTMSAITRDDEVILTPDRTYWAVLSTFGADMTGNFFIQASPNLVTCDAVPVSDSSWGTLKALYR